GDERRLHRLEETRSGADEIGGVSVWKRSSLGDRDVTPGGSAERRMRGQARRDDSRHALHVIEEILWHSGPSFRQVDDQHAFTIEPGIELLQVAQRSDEEARADEQ